MSTAGTLGGVHRTIEVRCGNPEEVVVLYLNMAAFTVLGDVVSVSGAKILGFPGERVALTTAGSLRRTFCGCDAASYILDVCTIYMDLLTRVFVG